MLAIPAEAEMLGHESVSSKRRETGGQESFAMAPGSGKLLSHQTHVQLIACQGCASCPTRAGRDLNDACTGSP
jgi:hypothetical protein